LKYISKRLRAFYLKILNQFGNVKEQKAVPQKWQEYLFSTKWITKENPTANRQPENTWRRRQVLSGKPYWDNITVRYLA
jgi:hypothetical protein